MTLLVGCQHREANQARKTSSAPVATAMAATHVTAKVAPRFSYTSRPYPVDERGFLPGDKALAKAYAPEELIADAAEGALNPDMLKAISGYPLDGTYAYHCSWTPREYDIYNGVTQDRW